MRSKLPILLALVLMAVATMPWLRSLESQRWSLPSGPTTVPPPEQAIASQAFQPEMASKLPPNNPRQENRATGESEATHEVQPSPRNSAEGSIGSHSGENSQVPLPKPQDLLNNAVRAVESQAFISARVKQQGEMFGRQITGEGRYFELRQGPIPQIRLELKADVGSASTSLVKVCNGATCWTYRRLPNRESLSKIDAVRAITALKHLAGGLPPADVASSPGLGGLGRLMRGLNARFEFTSVVVDQLAGLPVWKLSGKWRDAQLAKLLPDQKRAIENKRPFDLSRLPDHLPDGVTLYLGQGDCFPFRIDYLRGGGKSLRCLMGLEFWDLNFNGPIDPGQFLYAPSSLEIYDRTDEFIDRAEKEAAGNAL
jgi:hypothetical protein